MIDWESKVNEILDKMNQSNYTLSNSELAILENYSKQNEIVDKIVNDIKELRKELYDMEFKYNEKADIKIKKAFLRKLSSLKSKIYDLEDELIYTYQINDPQMVGLDIYTE